MNTLAEYLRLRQTDRVGKGVELPVDVRNTHLVEIDEGEAPYSAPCQRLH